MMEARLLLKNTEIAITIVKYFRSGLDHWEVNCDGCSGLTIWPIISMSSNVPFTEALRTVEFVPCDLYCPLNWHGCIGRLSPLACRLVLLDTKTMMSEA